MADFTLKFFLHIVFAEVSSHIVFEFKQFIAHRAWVLIRRIVLVHMVFQEMCAFKCFEANIASMIIIMRQKVFH